MIKICSLVMVDEDGGLHPGPVGESMLPLIAAAKKARLAGEIKVGKEAVKIAQAVVLSNFRPALKFRV